MTATSSTLYPCVVYSSIAFYYILVDWYNTNMRDMLTMVDCLGVYTNGLNYLLSVLIPNTAILLINALVYLSSPKTWSNNASMSVST
jgi:hypothetical protein